MARKARPLRPVLLAAALVAYQGRCFLSSFSPRSPRITVWAEPEERRSGASLKEEIHEILQRYAEHQDVAQVTQSYQEILAGTTLTAGLYNKALEAMALAARPQDGEKFLEFMQTQVQPDGSSYDHLVAGHLNANNSEEALRLVLSSPKPKLKSCKRVLRSLLEQKDSKSASRLMSCLPAMGLQPSYPMFKGMVRRAAEDGDLAIAEQWFQQLKEAGFQPDTGLFVSLIEGCSKVGDASNAVRYFNLMVAAGCEPSTAAYRFTISSLAKDKQVEAAMSWLERMAEAGLDPDEESYEAVLKVASRAQREDLASSWIEQLKQRGAVPRSAYLTLLRSVKELKDASKWLQKMREAGHKPSVNEYNYLLKACEVQRDADSAQKFFNRMVKVGLKPNAESYNLVIKTMAKAGKPKLAESWGKKMEAAGLVSSKSVQFGFVVKELANGQNAADYAAAWVKRAVNSGKRMEAPAYRAVMQAYLKEKKDDEARQWFEWMQQNGTKADYETYLMLMRENHRKAALWHEEMEEAGVAPTLESFNLVIRSFSNVKGKLRMQKVQEWFQRMQDAGITADAETYSQLISAAAKSGRLEDADRYFNQLSEKGLSPDRSVYQALMLQYLVKGDAVGVRQVLDWMVLKGIPIHRGGYNMAIRAFADAGDAAAAEQIYQRLLAAGRQPDERSFTFLIKAYAKSGDMSKAREWFKELLQRKLQPTFRIYEALIGGFAALGKVQETQEFLEELQLRKFRGISASAWSDMMLPALRCFHEAGLDEEVARWQDFSRRRGYEVVLDEDVEEQELPAPKETTRRRQAEVDPLKQLEAFRAEGRPPTLKDFNQMMQTFASSAGSRYSMAKTFIETSMLPEVKPNEKTFLLLLRCNRAGDGKRAVFTIQWMREQGYTVTRTHLELVVRQVLKDVVNDQVMDLEDFLLAKLSASIEEKQRSDLYDVLIRQAEQDGLMDKARHWAKVAREENIWLPSRTCYRLAKANLKEDEMSTLWWIRQSDPGATFAFKLGRFVESLPMRQGFVDRCSSFFSRLMATDSLSKEEVPYLKMIEAYSREEEPEGVVEWFDKMALAGAVDVDAYNAVIRSYAEVGDSEAARRWLARLEGDEQLAATAESYQAVLDVYASQGDTENALAVWKELSVPTDDQNCALLRGFCVSKDAKEVEAWMNRFQWEGLKLNWPTFLELARFYLDQGQIAKALGLTEEMASTGAMEDPGVWEQLLQAAREDAALSVEVAEAMVRHGASQRREGVLREILGDRFEALTPEPRHRAGPA